jgi:hypothetical protein
MKVIVHDHRPKTLRIDPPRPRTPTRDQQPTLTPRFRWHDKGAHRGWIPR